MHQRAAVLREFGQALDARKAAMGARVLCGPDLLEPLLTLDESTSSAIITDVAALEESPARRSTLSES